LKKEGIFFFSFFLKFFNLNSVNLFDAWWTLCSEIDQTTGGIMEETGKYKDTAFERKKDLEEEKERFQKAAYAVLGMLNDT